MTMHLTTEDLDYLASGVRMPLDDPSGRAPDLLLPATWVEALVAEVRRLRGLADDDTAVERAGRVYEKERAEHLVFDPALNECATCEAACDPDMDGALLRHARVVGMRAAIRAALGQEDA